MNELQKVLLKQLEKFHEFCEKNGLKYFIIGGTLLGAVRHKGFIPWDDDIDVGMPRKDYERLISIKRELFPVGYQLIVGTERREHVYLYSKSVNNNTTIVEGKIVEGVYIDVFPFDGMGDDSTTAKKHFKKCFWNRTLLDNKQRNDREQSLLHRLFQAYAHTKKIPMLLKNNKKLFCKYDFETSEYVANINGAYKYKEITKRCFLDELILYDFETIKVYGPKSAHEYLTIVYKNYMELPPIEKRKSHHNFLYVNLQMPFEEYLSQKK